MGRRTMKGVLWAAVGCLLFWVVAPPDETARLQPQAALPPPGQVAAPPPAAEPTPPAGRHLAEQARRAGSPLATAEGVWFFYQGDAATVTVAGDWNGWSPVADPLEPLAGTDLWAGRLPLPPEGLLNYRLVVDGQPRTDPWNPHRTAAMGLEFSVYVGPQSPGAEYEPPPDPPAVEVRRLEFVSAVLGRPVALQLHIPAACRAGACGAVYALDGNYYLGEGRLVQVTQQLHGRGETPPVVVAGIDPAPNPLLRVLETLPGLAEEVRVTQFVATEVIPAVERALDLPARPEERVLVGMSASGAAALQVAVRRPDLFRGVVVQSPVVLPDLRREILAFQGQRPRVSLTWGRFEQDLFGLDITGPAAALAAAMAAAGWPLRATEWPAGHTMAFWRRDLTPALRWVWADQPAGRVEGNRPAERLTSPPGS